MRNPVASIYIDCPLDTDARFTTFVTRFLNSDAHLWHFFWIPTSLTDAFLSDEIGWNFMASKATETISSEAHFWPSGSRGSHLDRILTKTDNSGQKIDDIDRYWLRSESRTLAVRHLWQIFRIPTDVEPPLWIPCTLRVFATRLLDPHAHYTKSVTHFLNPCAHCMTSVTSVLNSYACRTTSGHFPLFSTDFRLFPIFN